MVITFLSANVYVSAPNHRLSDADWELRQAAILLKSAFFESFAERDYEIHMEKVWIHFNYTLI